MIHLEDTVILILSKDPWRLKIPGYLPVGNGPDLHAALLDLATQFTGPLREELDLLVEEHAPFTWRGIDFTAIDKCILRGSPLDLEVYFCGDNRTWMATGPGSHGCPGYTPRLALEAWRTKALEEVTLDLERKTAYREHLCATIRSLESP